MDNIIKDQIITFDTAKLAKEKGLTHGLRCEGIYCIGWGSMKEDKAFSSSPRDNVNGQFHLALAPTQSALQKWLREVHKIYIVLTPHIDKNRNIIYHVDIYSESITEDDLTIWKYYNYEEGLEFGLQEALKLVIPK